MTLVADPPWMFSNQFKKSRGAVAHYKVMTLEDIKAYPLPPLAADSRLFLWRVASQQEEALEVCRAWGFVPKAEVVWKKVTSKGNRHMGMGHQVRMEHEICLIATRGSPPRLSRGIRSIFEAPVRKHSQKPEAFYDLVEKLSPGPYIELFARRRRSGWICLGDELEEQCQDS